MDTWQASVLKLLCRVQRDETVALAVLRGIDVWTTASGNGALPDSPEAIAGGASVPEAVVPPAIRVKAKATLASIIAEL